MAMISVIMPTYNQGAFVARSIKSLLLQSFQDWELIIVNDGSTDYTMEIIKDYPQEDPRIKIYCNDKNLGLGAALNKGIEQSKGRFIAYLPSDDIYYENHLQVLFEAISNNPDSVIAFSKINEHSPISKGHIGHESDVEDSIEFELIQVLHRKVHEKWMERNELTTGSLSEMYWIKLGCFGKKICTDVVSCEVTNHPEQRRKIIDDLSAGGIYKYKRYYNVTEPLIFRTRYNYIIDEISFYKKFRKEISNASKKESLKILIVGELAYNPERIFALEEYGHKLYGLWINNPDFYNATGPLPFGNVEEISLDNWIEEVKRIKPDIIYGMLNFAAISLCHYVMVNNPGVPFVWHFKEGPFFARQYGLWKELTELYCNADGAIFINQITKEWFSQFIKFESPTLVLDGDLPKRDWFIETPVPLLSDNDGEIHTVLPGRPLGIKPFELRSLPDQKIHLHIYGEFYHTTWANWIEEANTFAKGYIHLHPHCNADKWSSELAQYDAGWLHSFKSNNHGELIKANWNDLNLPARMSALAAAGLPLIQKNNEGHIVASQDVAKKINGGLFFDEMEGLGDCFSNKLRLENVRKNIWENRYSFSFDYHAEELTNFFYTVIKNYTCKNVATRNQ